MRPFIDDLDDFDFFDSACVRRLYEKQRHRETRFGSRLSNGPRHKRRNEDYDEYEDYDDYEDYEDYEDYQDYDENEFDSHAQLHRQY